LDDNILNKIIVIYGEKKNHHDNIYYFTENDFNIPPVNSAFGVPLYELKKIQTSYVDGVLLQDLFVYKNISLWWFLHPTFFPQFKNVVNFTLKFLEMIEQKDPSIIILKDFSNYEVIKEICNSKKIILRYSNLSILFFNLKKFLIKKLKKIKVETIFKNKIKKRIRIFNSQSKLLPEIDGKNIYVTPTIFRRKFFDLVSKTTKQGEYIQKQLIELLEKNSTICIDFDATYKGDFTKSKERFNEKQPWFPIEAILSNKLNDDHKIFLKTYDELISSKSFQDLFKYKGISIWNQMKNIFEELSTFPYIQNYLDLIDSIHEKFSNSKPKAIFLPYETGPMALAFITVARKFAIKTIGIQHATIFKNHPHYDHNFSNGENPHGFPLPDKLLLFGEFAKNVLIEQGYPSEKLVVFGNPHFFNLEQIKNALDQLQLRKKYSIGKNKKIILFATGKFQEYYGELNYDVQVWNYLLENFSDSKTYEIILKPHPQENTLVYQNLLQKKGNTNARIINGEIFELIYISDLIISIFSSFMEDSLCFNKPVIRVKFNDEKLTIPYDDYNVLLSSSLENLKSNIHKLFEDDSFRNELIKNLDSFTKHLYNIPEPKIDFTNLLKI
jgi:hypothetical protein